MAKPKKLTAAQQDEVIQNIEVGVDLGFTLARVIWKKLGTTASDWCGRRHAESAVSFAISGERIYPKVRNELAKSLGVSRERLDHLIARSRAKRQAAKATASK